MALQQKSDGALYLFAGHCASPPFTREVALALLPRLPALLAPLGRLEVSLREERLIFGIPLKFPAALGTGE